MEDDDYQGIVILAAPWLTLVADNDTCLPAALRASSAKCQQRV